MKQLLKIFFFAVLFIAPIISYGAELLTETHTRHKAEVVDVRGEITKDISGTGVEVTIQTIEARIISKERSGEIITFENDYIALEEGQKFYLVDTTHEDGTTTYMVGDPYRLGALGILTLLFLLVTFIFGGKQGIRGLLSLVGSLLLIFYILLPGLLHGYDPVLLSIGVSSLIIVVGSYVTHGFNRTTTTAVIGMIGTIIITGILAKVAVVATHLTGFAEDESVYLNFNTGGTLDFAGLLLGAIMIGLLGTLYDAAISQAIAVEEIHHTDPTLTRTQVYKKVIRIGREHIGALVDTLAIAYVGAALPLLLLFVSTTSESISTIINREIFATEIVRIIVGSIGVILAVPMTTLVASIMLVRPGKTPRAPSHKGHSHVHAHHH